MCADDRPTCRATVRGDSVTLNRWVPAMTARGPERAGLRRVRAALADLHKDGDELIVVPVRGVPWTDRAGRALVAWARLVGYRRVWLPGEVVTFDDEPAAIGPVAVRCPGCGAAWEDEGVTFWEHVRATGWFPGHCLACGGSLPEWTPVPARHPRTARQRLAT